MTRPASPLWGLAALALSAFPASAQVSAAYAQPVSAGDAHTCAIYASRVYCWGLNAYGQLGNGTGTNSAVPVLVTGLTSGMNVVSVAAGQYHTCALTSLGDVWCWGSNQYGQLGVGGLATSSVPVKNGSLGGAASSLRAGKTGTCAVVAGKGRCWGQNDSGQLGNGFAVPGGPTPVTVGTLAGFTADVVSLGDKHACALGAEGSGASYTEALYCWGLNTSGQVGTGTTTSPVFTPVRTSTMQVGSVSAGRDHTCATASSSTGTQVYCWGSNGFGQMGTTASTALTLRPALVPGLLARRVEAGQTHTCAVGTDGTATCWGANAEGQSSGRSVPAHPTTSVAGLPTGTVTDVSAGSAHSCAVLQNGSIWCRGRNGAGELGYGTVGTTYLNANQVLLNAVAAEAAAAPEAPGLTVWPSVARGAASVRVTLAAGQTGWLVVTDLLGRVQMQAAVTGAQTLALPAEAWASGAYVVRLTMGETVATARFLVAR